jgi:hypothetical protein
MATISEGLTSFAWTAVVTIPRPSMSGQGDEADVNRR